MQSKSIEVMSFFELGLTINISSAASFSTFELFDNLCRIYFPPGILKSKLRKRSHFICYGCQLGYDKSYIPNHCKLHAQENSHPNSESAETVYQISSGPIANFCNCFHYIIKLNCRTTKARQLERRTYNTLINNRKSIGRS